MSANATANTDFNAYQLETEYYATTPQGQNLLLEHVRVIIRSDLGSVDDDPVEFDEYVKQNFPPETAGKEAFWRAIQNLVKAAPVSMIISTTTLHPDDLSEWAHGHTPST